MKNYLCLWMSLFLINGYAQSELKLWYTQPSGATWENALPIGNGRLGAMIYGNVAEEIMQLNEHTVWSGSPNRNDNPAALAALPEIRRLIFEGKHKEAEMLAGQTIISKKSHGQKFEPFGNLHLKFDGHEDFSNYRRELDLKQAISKISYKVGEVTYTRDAFASLADNVIVIHLSANAVGKLTFSAFYTSPQLIKNILVTPAHDLILSGTTSDHEGVKGMVRFKGMTRIKLDGGSITSTDTSLIVQNATAATLYISIATNFNNYHDLQGDETSRASEYLNKAFDHRIHDLKVHI